MRATGWESREVSNWEDGSRELATLDLGIYGGEDIAGSQDNLSKGMYDRAWWFGCSTASVKPNGRTWKGGLSTGHDGLAMECVWEKIRTHLSVFVGRERRPKSLLGRTPWMCRVGWIRGGTQISSAVLAHLTKVQTEPGAE